jgi:protoporphyrin/coproporphyrin ferrochelatase
MHYQGEPSFDHRQIPAVGVLLLNLGTPEAPTTPALRRYLKEFLSDPRIVEQPRWLWQPILHGIILNIRPPRSAAAYRRIWTDKGSPLLIHSQGIAAGLAQSLAQRYGNPPHVELAMRYGRPAVAEAMARLRDKGCRRMVVLPLYPQYSATSTGSALDAVWLELTRWRWMPEIRTISGYHDHPGYIAAIADSIRDYWQHHGRPERLLFSFHGIPRRYFLAGDPYHCLCHKTARLVAEALELEEGTWKLAFQSLFGREEWLRPYTSDTLKAWGKERINNVHVICPGFSADCLETLDEIAVENRHVFTHAGGGEFHYIPALNAAPSHIEALSTMVGETLRGWCVDKADWDADAAAQEAVARAERAEKLRKTR